MTGKAFKNLLIVAGLALLLAIGVVLPLRAAPRPAPASLQETGVMLKISTTPPITLTAGQDITLTAKIHNGIPVSITGAGLTFVLPAEATTAVSSLEQKWPVVAPADTVVHSIPVHISEQAAGTLRFAATLQYVVTQTTEISDSIEVVVAISTTFASAISTLTPTETTPTVVPTEALVPTKTPIPTVEPVLTNTPVPPLTRMPTAAPPPTGVPPTTPSPTPAIAIVALTKNLPVIAGGCLVLLVLFVGIALILWALRKKRPRVVTPPPPPASAGPYLESVSPAGSPRRLYLKPEGVTIGRGPENDLVVPQDLPGWDTLSHQHARIYEQAGRWIVEDLHSMNGIYVNGRRTGRNLLRDGWRLGIGGAEFVFHAGTGEA